MNTVKERLSELRVKDLTMVILCLITIYLLRARESFLLKPEWRIDSDVALPSKDNDKQEILPQPVIADIENDGINEVVMVTSDFHLQISAMPPQAGASVLPHMEVKYKVELPHDFAEDGKRSFPVAMTAGFLHANSTLHQVGKQVIVVVTDNWNVYCYDHTLLLLWSVTLLDLGQSRQQYYVKAMSVVVTPHISVRDGQGMVIVGGSFGHKLHGQKTGKFRSDSTWQSFSAMPDDSMKKAEDTAVHFSTFALSGNNGSTLWHHLPSDFQQSEEETLWKAHHWKLALNRRQHHSGEVHWSKYLHHLIKFLPHRWDGIYDTKFEMARIKRSGSDKKRNPETSTLEDLVDLEGGNIVGYASGQNRGIQGEIKNPNALVIQHHNGIEVLNLVNGQPVTQLALSAEKSTYADINNDGTVDEVKLVWHQKEKNCEAVVSSVHPVNKLVFSQSVCSPTSWSSSIFSSLFSSPEDSEDLRLSVAPLVIKSVTKRAGIFNHLSGRSLSSNQKGSDVVFLTSSGRLTSYGPYGELNWSVKISSTWSDISQVSEESLYKNSEIGQIYRHLFKPSMQPMAAKLNGRKTTVLVTAWNRMTLVDLKDGHVLGEHSLPCQPISPPVLGDYNNDGLTDIIVACNIGYLGFGVEHHFNHLYTMVLGVGAILGVWFLIWCCTPEHTDDYRDDLSDM